MSFLTCLVMACLECDEFPAREFRLFFLNQSPFSHYAFYSIFPTQNQFLPDLEFICSVQCTLETILSLLPLVKMIASSSLCCPPVQPVPQLMFKSTCGVLFCFQFLNVYYAELLKAIFKRCMHFEPIYHHQICFLCPLFIDH